MKTPGIALRRWKTTPTPRNRKRSQLMSERPPPELRREDFKNALKEFDTYIDVTLEDLTQINRMA